MTEAPKGWQCANKPEISTGHRITQQRAENQGCDTQAAPDAVTGIHSPAYLRPAQCRALFHGGPMHRSTHAIELDIATRRQIIADQQKQLAALDHELSTARALELAGRRRQGHIAHVLARFESGETIATTPRAWWCRDGQLLGRASGDDLAAMYSLREQGVIEALRVAS